LLLSVVECVVGAWLRVCWRVCLQVPDAECFT